MPIEHFLFLFLFSFDRNQLKAIKEILRKKYKIGVSHITLTPAPCGEKQAMVFATARLWTWSFMSRTSNRNIFPSWIDQTCTWEQHKFSLQKNQSDHNDESAEQQEEDTLTVLSSEPLYNLSSDSRMAKLVTAFVCSWISCIWSRILSLPLHTYIASYYLSYL